MPAYVMLTLEETAARYRMSPDRFRKRLDRLYEFGFPAPIAGFGRRMWSPGHLAAWEAWQQGAELRGLLMPPIQTAGEQAVDVEDWSRELAGRLMQGAKQ